MIRQQIDAGEGTSAQIFEFFFQSFISFRRNIVLVNYKKDGKLKTYL